MRHKGDRNKKTLIKEALMQQAVAAGLDPVLFADAQLRAALARKKRGTAAKLSFADMVLITQLGEEGKTQEDIAALYHVDQATISRVQQALADTRPYAKRQLHAAAAELATVAVTASRLAGQAGNAEPALELLDRLDVAPRKRQEASGAKILVVVGQSDPRALPPLLEAARALPTDRSIPHAD